MSLLDPEFKARPGRTILTPANTPDADPTIADLSRAGRVTAKILSFPLVSVANAAAVAPVVPDHRPAMPSATSGYHAMGKRLFDILVVLATAPFWGPLILIAALFVMRDGHSPFYTQERIGRGGRVFRMLKLRSMVPNADALLEAHLAADPAARAEWDTSQKLKCDPRITRVGRFIRKSSIDELPQILNVLKGDMSLVGPRPFMTSQTDLYDGDAYYSLRPGLTGLWQVSDRNESSFKARVQFDNAYLRDLSLITDLRVLMQTVGVVLRGTGY